MGGGTRVPTAIMPGVSDLWWAMPVLAGRLIRLEPLALEHAPGYLAAAGTGEAAAEVFRWLSPPGGAVAQPVTLEDAARHIVAALDARDRGARLAYAQIDAATGEFAGTTSFYEVNPALRALSIGHTWLGQRWWRTGHNTESKLLMMTFAFETLGAVRVVWHTDILNTRSQAAIERLGATREGVLRKHRLRYDGSWRDTVQYAMVDDDWPAAKIALVARLGTASTAATVDPG
jgi:N-acetyltransferase